MSQKTSTANFLYFDILWGSELNNSAGLSGQRKNIKMVETGESETIDEHGLEVLIELPAENPMSKITGEEIRECIEGGQNELQQKF